MSTCSTWEAFPVGTKGIVVWVTSIPQPGMPFAAVRLDPHFAALDPWRNELQVWAEEDGEVTWVDFVRVRTTPALRL